MTEFVILSRADILTLCDDKPVTVYVDKKPYVLCTDEYFEKQRNEPHENDHKCHTCKHYTRGEHDGSCGSYICKEYSNWESEVQNADSD